MKAKPSRLHVAIYCLQIYGLQRRYDGKAFAGGLAATASTEAFALQAGEADGKSDAALVNC